MRLTQASEFELFRLQGMVAEVEGQLYLILDPRVLK